jgi:hypothetical protein
MRKRELITRKTVQDECHRWERIGSFDRGTRIFQAIAREVVSPVPHLLITIALSLVFARSFGTFPGAIRAWMFSANGAISF